ncbi:MAG: hypothetical protein WAX80_02605 [Minisyncoccia bacterium]
MSIDTYNFFIIVLSGFMAVWAYRRFSYSKSSISDFEYLGFSVFWGTIILFLVTWSSKDDMENFKLLLGNPYAAGLVLSFVGILTGFLTSKLRLLYGGKYDGTPSIIGKRVYKLFRGRDWHN